MRIGQRASEDTAKAVADQARRPAGSVGASLQRPFRRGYGNCGRINIETGTPALDRVAEANEPVAEARD
jgi:hypothetical protein